MSLCKGHFNHSMNLYNFAKKNGFSIFGKACLQEVIQGMP